jgi:ribosome-binding factor A
MGKKTRFQLPEGLAREPKRRPARVADLIRNEVAMLLLMGMKDPRVQNVTLVRVHVTDNLRTARLYYTCQKEKEQEVGEGLASASGYIRSHLAKQLQLRFVPELIFAYDASLDEVDRLNELLSDEE